jgi:glutamate dehydrogenase
LAGDAFASGGSQGYDHKVLGITARGAWACVRTHFRELDVDVDTAPLRIVGIGDMGGDVFGNGLLRSPHVRLVAAFNHKDVFLDPDPDPARSFAERQRLFAAGRSWDSYDPAVLSPGGLVARRAAKKVALTPETRELLGVTEDEPSGEAVVRAILRLDADLLWNGGIGTYVRAPDESDARRRSRERRRPRRRRRRAREGCRRGRQPRRDSGAGRVPSRGDASTSMQWTIRPASTPPTTR